VGQGSWFRTLTPAYAASASSAGVAIIKWMSPPPSSQQSPQIRVINYLANQNVVASVCDAGAEAPVPLPVCPWLENPYGLVSLFDMLKFNAHHFVAISNTLGALSMEIASGGLPQARSLAIFGEQFKLLRQSCGEIGMPLSSAAIDRAFVTLARGEFELEGMRNIILDIQQRVWDELSTRTFVQVPTELADCYESAAPLFGKEVFDRFPSAIDDISEAGSCLALERNTAAVFHRNASYGSRPEGSRKRPGYSICPELGIVLATDY
jgi:hypothetical protein